MTNTVSAAYKIVNPNRTQAYLRHNLIADAITKAEFGNVAPAQEIRFPYGNSIAVQTYGYQTGNARTDMTLTKDSYNVDQAKTAVMGYDRIQNLLVQNPDWVSTVEQEMGQQLARNVDQFAINKGVTSAFTTVTGGTLAAGNLLQTLANANAYLDESLAMPGQRYVVLDPLRAALLPQMNASAGFVNADNALIEGVNGFSGQTAVGFKVFISNQLLYSNSFTMGTNPTNGQTLTIGGYTWNFATTATNPGDVYIGAAASNTQATLVTAINASGTPSSTTYIEPLADDRVAMQNAQLTCGAFSSNVATITKYGRMNISSTVTAAVVGTETSNLLAGVMGAIDLTMLQTPFFEELPASVAVGSQTHAKDMMMTTLFGAGVWNRRKRALAKISFNA